MKLSVAQLIASETTVNTIGLNYTIYTADAVATKGAGY